MPAVFDMRPVGERVSMCRGRLETGRSDPMEKRGNGEIPEDWSWPVRVSKM